MLWATLLVQVRLKAIQLNSDCLGVKATINDIKFFGGIIMNRTITHKHLKKQVDFLETAEDLYPLFKELEFSTLLLPTKIENNILAFPTIDFDGEKFIPVFTDVYGYDKVNFIENFTLISNSFDFYLNHLDDGLDGIIIDVEGVKLPIPREFKDAVEPDQIFNQELHFHTIDEVRQVKSQVNNSILEKFLQNESNFWDIEKLLNILSKSDVFAIGLSSDNLSMDSNGGIIHIDEPLPKATYRSASQSYALIYSSENEIKPKNNPLYPYSQLINFPFFARQVLLDDLDGIILNENSQNITIPREFLFDYIENLELVDLNSYDDFAFKLNL